MNTKGARVIAAQFYVAKNLNRNPAKTVQFIIDNRDYFPSIDDDEIEKLKKEHNLTEEELEKNKTRKLADIDLEKKRDEERKKKDSLLHGQRRVERRDRDFGRGFGENPNVYETPKDQTEFPDFEKYFSDNPEETTDNSIEEFKKELERQLKEMNIDPKQIFRR